MSQPLAPSHTVRVDLGARSYDILIGAGLLRGAGHHIAPLCRKKRVFALTDTNVASLHLDTLAGSLEAAGIDTEAFVIEPGEASKSWASLGAVTDWLLQAKAGRDDLLVALGGGIVGDLAGFAAAIMKRGMGFVQVPTTLLAQVDSSVGGKTAINTRFGKNLIGSFYQPKLVLADMDVLATLPPREWRAGIAEVVKYGLIDDPGFFEWLETSGTPILEGDTGALAEAVAVSCESKARIVAADETENGVRALLNLGHTFGHALEAANGYGPALLHGEAVGCGMAMAFRYSRRLGLCPGQDVRRAEALLASLGLTVHISKLGGGPYVPEDLLDAMKQDKKVRGTSLPLILARGIGRSFIRPDNDLDDLLAFLREEAALEAS